MNDTQHFKLIDGTFAPLEAARVLLSLVEKKIDYHRMEKFSNEERFGRDASHSEERLVELAKLANSLKEVIAAAADAKMKLKINGTIEITLVP